MSWQVVTRGDAHRDFSRVGVSSIAKLAQGGWKLAPRKETRQAAQPCGKLACFHAGSIEEARS